MANPINMDKAKEALNSFQEKAEELLKDGSKVEEILKKAEEAIKDAVRAAVSAQRQGSDPRQQARHRHGGRRGRDHGGLHAQRPGARRLRQVARGKRSHRSVTQIQDPGGQLVLRDFFYVIYLYRNVTIWPRVQGSMGLNSVAVAPLVTPFWYAQSTPLV